jgi:DNA-directed RNA polymerase subunit RPC12/RpoP
VSAGVPVALNSFHKENIMDTNNFVCRSCGSRKFFNAGTVQRHYLIIDKADEEAEGSPSMQHEMVHLYACASCTTAFLLPPAFTVGTILKESDGELEDEDVISSHLHPSQLAEED